DGTDSFLSFGGLAGASILLAAKLSIFHLQKTLSEEVLIKTLKNRIKALEEENKQLKDQVQKLHGKLF
ncbi:hypothetical protein PPOP_1937, partial [Paenibacillus popilliae ATCC 14706]